MFELIVGFLLGIYFWKYWTHPRTRDVKPGYQKDVFLPHTEELELHHFHTSSNSQKVRGCLAETGLKHKVINHNLPSMGDWETKRYPFLRDVNPAGTVPVLVHKGHPIYESHEQIIYIDQVLMPGGPRLTPEDPEKRKLMDKWVDSGSMIMSEMSMSDPWPFLKKRAGNMLMVITMPAFCAGTVIKFDFWTMVESISMIPMIKDKKLVVLLAIFKMYGVNAFQKFSTMGNMVGHARKALNHHFQLLTQDLEKKEGPYICGDQYTLADISLVPIFERMEYTGWWTESLMKEFPEVVKYWNTIKERDGYQASRPNKEWQSTLTNISRMIEGWKTEYEWFNAYYQ